MSPRQLPLPLALPPERGAPVLPDSSNAVARTWLAAPDDWPGGRLALFGPEGVGKSLLLRQAAARLGLRVLEGSALRGVPDGLPSAVDDADCAAEEEALFHLINACSSTGALLLLAGREPPARWRVKLPDLASRLRAIHAVEVEEPSEQLLRALLAHHFAERQVRVDPATQDWLLLRLPREAAAVSLAAARLDRAALAAGGAVTRALARQVLADLPFFGAEEDAAADDVSVADGAGGSNRHPTLL
ncbi:chromosomal replication initiator DnaA [Roseomonas sp. BN140053]|uniref:chromosomal replication initiator DnaA n=1 Tax=Roseomonas sp. BN140053 TaxID=3391898 RepID=UPI0039EB53E2